MLSEPMFNCHEDEPAAERAAETMRALLRNAGAVFDSIGWDHYDGSLELYGVPPDWRMSPELQRLVYGEGFIKAYVNHADKWETHYSFGTKDGFVAKPGWRVSYPHKRDDGGCIWVEDDVPTWPRKWFDTGYALVKRAISSLS